jgi:hypothetical protein
LADAEKKLGMPKMLRIYPSDFWIGNSRESNQSVAKGTQEQIQPCINASFKRGTKHSLSGTPPCPGFLNSPTVPRF